VPESVTLGERLQPPSEGEVIAGTDDAGAVPPITTVRGSDNADTLRAMSVARAVNLGWLLACVIWRVHVPPTAAIVP
jgi:hypothetical protein